MGSSGAVAGGGSGVVSTSSSRAIGGGGEGALGLGGLPWRLVGTLAEDEWDVPTIVVFLLLKAGPPTDSSSSSDAMCTTPSFKGA